MLTHMNTFLPVWYSLNIAIYGSHCAKTEYPLIWEKCQHHDHGFTPAPFAPVGLQKLMETCQVYEGCQNATVEWQKGKHGKPEWKLDEKEHYQRGWHHERKERL